VYSSVNFIPIEFLRPTTFSKAPIQFLRHTVG
jgi:hypothetical protein